jgi:hypothetical protein
MEIAGLDASSSSSRHAEVAGHGGRELELRPTRGGRRPWRRRSPNTEVTSSMWTGTRARVHAPIGLGTGDSNGADRQLQQGRWSEAAGEDSVGGVLLPFCELLPMGEWKKNYPAKVLSSIF